MDDESEPSMEELAAAIDRYLDDNPRAKDTADGVRRWWLPGLRHSVTLDRTEAALEWLVAAGKAQRTVGPGGVTLYARPNQRGPGTSSGGGHAVN